MKKKHFNFENIIEMKCQVCEKCYRYADCLSNTCIFGGPYTGYTIVKSKSN